MIPYLKQNHPALVLDTRSNGHFVCVSFSVIS